MKDKENINNCIKFANCTKPKTSIDDDICKECPSKGCCLTINPELASMLERCKNSDGIYELKSKDWYLLQMNYPDTLNLNIDNDSCDFDYPIGMTEMKEFMTVAYYNTEIMPKVLNKKIVNRLENDEYSYEEIEALYEWSTRVYDIRLKRLAEERSNKSQI